MRYPGSILDEVNIPQHVLHAHGQQLDPAGLRKYPRRWRIVWGRNRRINWSQLRARSEEYLIGSQGHESTRAVAPERNHNNQSLAVLPNQIDQTPCGKGVAASGIQKKVDLFSGANLPQVIVSKWQYVSSKTGFMTLPVTCHQSNDTRSALFLQVGDQPESYVVLARSRVRGHLIWHIWLQQRYQNIDSK